MEAARVVPHGLRIDDAPFQSELSGQPRTEVPEMDARLDALKREIQRYNPAALLLTSVLACFSSAILCIAVGHLVSSYLHVAILALLTVLTIMASSRHSLKLKGTHTGVSVTDCLIFLVVVMYGPYEAALLAAVDGFVASHRIKARPLFYIFNAANFAASFFVAGSLFRLVGFYINSNGGALRIGHPVLVFAIPLLVLGVAFYGINYTLTAVLTKLVFNASFRDTVWKKLPWEPLVYVTEAVSVGVLHYVAVNQDLITMVVTLFLALPVPVLIYYTFKAYKERLEERDQHFKELTDINDSILEMLAMAVDAKDQTTHDHLQRVRLFATKMGQNLGLSEPEINALKAGALLHDIGKIGVPAYILNKPGKLTQHEFQQMTLHTIIGADMLANVNFGYPVVPVVRHHHERWDGKGYPDGLKGEQIPITARILTLVDNYDALRSERPYHTAWDRDKTLEYLRENAGVYFDPTLVELFISMVDDLETQAAKFKSKAKGLSSTDSLALRSAMPAAGLDMSENENRVASALQTIADTNQRVTDMYELTRNLAGVFSLDETSAVLSKGLAKLVPFTTCALSIFDANRSEFEIVHADGRHAEQFAGRRLPVSAGIVGWVIQNQRPMYNSNPVLDLGFLGQEAAGQYQSVMVFPLVKNKEPLGAIALYSTEIQNYASEYIQLLESIAPPISDSIFNVLAFERARRSALTDPVTGLSNIQAFAAHFSREQARSFRSGMPLSVVIVAIENLSEAAFESRRTQEDLMGSLGRMVKARLRESDLIARRSSGSFILLLTDSGRSEALEVLARMHDTIAQSAGGTTLSINLGAATSPHDGDTLEDLVEAATLRNLPAAEVISELGLAASLDLESLFPRH
jgi:diguanylate cyclase (GGDEF)-like protein/putative nucleotidyltransferase with HDIG domain